MPPRVVDGGGTRSDSVWRGLTSLPAEAPWVAIAEAARPFFGAGLVDRILDQLRANSERSVDEQPCGAVPMARVADSLHRVGPASMLVGCVDRDLVQAAQTPQVVRRDCLVDAYSVCGAVPGLNDEASLVTRAGGRMLALPGVPRNMKITFVGDVELAEAIHRLTPPGTGREQL